MSAGTSDENWVLLVMLPMLESGGNVVGARGGAMTGVRMLTDVVRASDEDGGVGGTTAGIEESEVKDGVIEFEGGGRSGEAGRATLGSFPNSNRDLRLDGCSIHFPTQLLATQHQPPLLRNLF